MASAGRILIMPKGTYDSSATYEMLDMVHHNGTSWLAKKSVTGIEPSAANSEHWHNMFNLNIVNNLDATGEGSVLDARVGQSIKDQLSVRHRTATTTETLTFKNGVAEVTEDLSGSGECYNVLITPVDFDHSFTPIIKDLTPSKFRIKILDTTDSTLTSTVTFRITYFFG